ncbi:hypothetical protein COHA_002177 [Chlorella ohadii]|uniref:Major facilitator superfamily (MFS) profile domain-containing protein n=1 Tax=Chlorella ohadii TaxID=2649997 RepID=A0AAD5E185_9CHLO|nr:hypothetical protein COHA_002177 [Chlorella ohadii]
MPNGGATAETGVDPAAEPARLALPLPPPPPPDVLPSERDGLLGEHAPRSCSPFHALEIQSDEGSSYEPHPKAVLAAGPAATDPTERLLPAKRPEGEAEVLPGGLSRRGRLRMVILFSVTAAFLYADQNLMAPNLTAIAEGIAASHCTCPAWLPACRELHVELTHSSCDPTDFGFDEQQRDRMLGGAIAAAFYMVGAPAALLFGWLSDRVNRKRLLFAAVVLGEGPCMLTIFVTNYWQLFTLRLLTGIALGGALPVVFSLLGDLYDTSRRAGVSSMLATGIGLACGQGIAGFVGPAWGWRWPFVIVSVPAVAAACLMLYTCHEPKRGGTEAALQAQFQASRETAAVSHEHSLFSYNEQLTWRKLGRLLLIPTNVLVISQGLFGCLPWGMILTYLNDYLSQNKGLRIQTATLVLLVLGIGGAVGVLGGGWVGQWCYNRRKWSMPVFIGICTVLGTLPMLWLVNANVAAMPALTVIFAFLSGALSGTVGPNMRAMMLNVNEPETRGIALALQTMLDDLGKGLGPVFVAFFIERLGRTGAFNLSTLGWVPCGLLLLGTACTLARDESAMQHRLHKVLSSYTFSSAALDRMAEQEQQQPDGEASTGGDAWQQRQEQQRGGSSIGRHSSTGSLGIEQAPP